MKILCTGLVILCSIHVSAQSIQGRIMEQWDGTPVSGVTIYITLLEAGAVSDSLGYFRIKNLPPDRYEVDFSHIAFQSKTISNVIVNAGKATVVKVSLVPSALELSEITVSPVNAPFTPGSRVIDEEQINRYAATYYDPARLMASSPEVYITNDQNNEVSIRGISPDYNIWRLEGAEIVNPNHLSNAGTITDQPAGTSGGVNILSAQMLSTSSLHYGVFDNTMNNSVGGIFDMHLKEGASSDYQFVTQASFIGFDLGAEGPFSKSGKSTFITNYRYSFTGLLTNMGVDFGGESISFQDLSFTFNFPFQKGEGLKIFGTGGLNFNDFLHKPFAESEVEKDRRDILYDGKMGLAGMTYNLGRFNGTIIYSGFDNRRRQIEYDSLDNPVSSAIVNRNESVLSTNLYYTMPVTAGSYTAGVVNNFYEYAGFREGLSQFYLSALLNFVPWMETSMGFTVSTNDTDQPEFDPRLTLTFWPYNVLSWHVGAGRFTQLLRPSNFYFVNVGNEDSYVLDDDYSFISSIRSSTGLTYTVNSVRVLAELFYYHFPEVHYVNNQDSIGEATSKGISINVSRSFSGNWYLLAGGNFFEAEIDDKLSSPFDAGFGVNAAAGREWKWRNGERQHIVSIDTRLSWQGGQKYTPPLSDPLTDPFASQLNDYVRFDVRIDWKRSRNNRSTTFALDIQNVANRANQGFAYFDEFINAVKISDQLGLIPIFTYRLEF